jgi:threonine/homoserine/homoserine lactone efflux protein
MKKNFYFFLFTLFSLIALLGIGLLFLAEKGAQYDFQKQYVILSGVFLIIIGFLLYLIKVMGRADQTK